MLPITHTQPADSNDGLEIPAPTKRRLGLDDRPSWVITTELNKFFWPGPDIRKTSHNVNAQWEYGFLPQNLIWS